MFSTLALGYMVILCSFRSALFRQKKCSNLTVTEFIKMVMEGLLQSSRIITNSAKKTTKRSFVPIFHIFT